ncbi:adenosine deaminase family protein [Marinimicrobium sp. ARAG 43.8]|uniref:adenosine deaminase family protein n=1 Tax=Marinimicrobium sp. ARAG 43.8 TaxID=3418719 RepID=UPI003CF59559
MSFTPLSKPLTAAWCVAVFWLVLGAMQARADDAWFEAFKAEASDRELYTFLYAMPKGGDLHNHMSGSGMSEWWYELALAQKAHGYEFYTKVRIDNCKPFGHNEYGRSPYLLMFHNIRASTYETLPACEKGEYKKLSELNEEERQGWLDSLRLNHDHEGRDEFFSTHWQRFDELLSSPYLMMEILYRNMEAFGKEGLIYLEAMMGAKGFRKPDGSPIPAETVVQMYKDRLAQKDAKDTGVTVRFQESILRFAPNAEQQLIDAYEFVSENSDLYLAVNMVGREDNDKGYPMRFKDTLRELRRTYNNVRLSIHAGELDEPNRHVRDTLMLGADRIGHGIQVINDEDLLRQMRHGPYLIEINLISNLLLEYVDDYSQHPFPEYLRIGVPVALSTDDRGMWDSNITDEFFVAVKEYNLSWSELKQLSRNSLAYSFVDDETKEALLKTFEQRIKGFETAFRKRGVRVLEDVEPVSYSFTCRFYDLCDWGR